MDSSFRVDSGSTVSEREGPILASSSYFNGNYSTKLNPQHIDIDEEDQSCWAKLTRGITAGVGAIFHPGQIIAAFRLLKALTFCCLCLTITAELLYIFFVECSVSLEVRKKLGGIRDILIRLYGVGLAVIAVPIELDMKVADRNFSFLKSFIPRSFLLFFIAALSSTAPVIGYESRLYPKRNNYDDDYYSNYNTQIDSLISSEVPGSAVAFQSTTSFLLFLCSITYFVFGIFCLDKFTAKAFLSNDDPVSSTAIEPRNNNEFNDSRDTMLDYDHDLVDRGTASIEYEDADMSMMDNSGIHSYTNSEEESVDNQRF